MNFFGFDFATREEPAKLEQGHMEESAQDNGEAEGDGDAEAEGEGEGEGDGDGDGECAAFTAISD